MKLLKKIFGNRSKPQQVPQEEFPLEIRTSEKMIKLTTIKGGRAVKTVREAIYLVAKCKGTTSPKNQFWEVQKITPESDILWEEGSDIVLKNATYEKAMEHLKNYELEICRVAGMTGTDEEIIAARAPYAEKNNVLRFYETKPAAPLQQYIAPASEESSAVLKEDIRVGPPMRLKKP